MYFVEGLSLINSLFPNFIISATFLHPDSYDAVSNQIMIDCFVFGNPRPVVTWYRNKKPICACDKYSLISENSLHKLIILNPDHATDSGEYVCEIENEFGQQKLPVPVNVQRLIGAKVESNKTMELPQIRLQQAQEEELEEIDKRSRKAQQPNSLLNLEETRKSLRLKDDEKNRLVIESYLKNVSCNEGSTAQFLFAVRGRSPRVAWTKNGIPLEENYSKYKMENRNGVISLQIYKVSAQDAGDYACNSYNEINSVNTSSQLIVQQSHQQKKTILKPTVYHDQSSTIEGIIQII